MSYFEFRSHRDVPDQKNLTADPKYALNGIGQRTVNFNFFYSGFGKRVVDIALSLLILPVLVPAMIGIWILVRLDGGKATFKQSRVGRNGRIFTCYKFRSMVPDAEAALTRLCEQDPKVAQEWADHQKLRNDTRVTKIGAFIRKTSLDELPQIINVLLGDMSLVGPRPFLPSQKCIYDGLGGKAYYQLRPGITGLWQIMSRDDTTFAARVHFDEAYANHLTMSGDLSLILQTAKVVVRHTGA
jgi:lipopolysaccharide/colanic/teichoic acid biosynthesis glycosyltransferase